MIFGMLTVEHESIDETPRAYDMFTIVITICADIITILFSLLFLTNLLLQIKSMIKLVAFLTQSRRYRVIIVIIIAILSLTYLNDVALMLALPWGLPAFDMVSVTVDTSAPNKSINSYIYCLFNTDIGDTVEDYYYLVNIINKSMTIQLYSRIL